MSDVTEKKYLRNKSEWRHSSMRIESRSIVSTVTVLQKYPIFFFFEWKYTAFHELSLQFLHLLNKMCDRIQMSPSSNNWLPHSLVMQNKKLFHSSVT